MISSDVAQASLARIVAASKSEDDLAYAATQFETYIMSCSRDLPLDEFTKVLNDLANPIRQLIDHKDRDENMAGVVAISTLAEVFEMEASQMRELALKNAELARRALALSNDPRVMALAAKTFARLVAIGGTIMYPVAEMQIKGAIEWLQGDRQDDRRYAAALIIKELSKIVPDILQESMHVILDNLWTALRDPKIPIREAAADALSGCLDIVSLRDASSDNEAFRMVFDQAQRGLKSTNPDTIHGSLLGFKELFVSGRMFMEEHYNYVCETIFSYKDHREGVVRKAVIELMPTLANYNQNEFNAKYLHKCMAYLIGQVKKDKDRTTCFHAIGHIALVVTNNMATYLDPILDIIREGLQMRGRKNVLFEDSIFQCISMLARAVGQALTKHMHDLLDLMFTFGLTRSLKQALNDLAHYIPPLLPTIQERLLDLLALALSGEPFRPPGAPATSGSSSSVSTKVNPTQRTRDPKEKEKVLLALQTLAVFTFSGHVLTEFVRDCVVPYVEDDTPEIRREAAITCCKVFSRDPIVFQTSNHAIELVGEVMEKLLSVAIADPDSIIRLTVLAALEPRFDRHLAQAENVRSLFIALNDELYQVREEAIKIIGRLAMHNPAYVMPGLRKVLLQLLTELEYSDTNRNKEESAKLLSQLIAASHLLTKPYVVPVLKVLLPKGRDPSPAVASSVINAIGELACVGGEDIVPYLKECMDLLIDSLHDQASPTKRLAALSTLGMVCSNTAYVIEPYIDYPQLLPMLTGILKSESNQPIRKETIRAMGVLGALDPHRHTVSDVRASEALEDSTNPADPSHPANIGPSHEDYYPTVAFNALLAIFKDPSLRDHHRSVVEAIMFIFDSLRLRCVSHLPQIIPAFLPALRSQSVPSSVREFYFEKFGRLISIMEQHIRNHVPPILQLIRDCWATTPQLQGLLVGLMVSLATALGGEFKIYLPTLLPMLLQSIEHTPDRANVDPKRVLQAFDAFGSNLEEYLHLVLPAIAATFENTNVRPEVRRYAVDTINRLCRKINFVDHASRLILPLDRVLNTSRELRPEIMNTLCALLSQLGSSFSPFIPIINRTLHRNDIRHERYDSLVSKFLKGELIPQEIGADDTHGGESTVVASDAGTTKLPVNQQNLKSAWEPIDNPKAEDWKAWLRRLSIQLLKSSPSHPLRACANLALEYNPLARELFNAAFVSCWTELYGSYQGELVAAIEKAMSSPTAPAEVTQALLNLAEFMEHDDKQLAISIQTLGANANRCGAYAKALHYMELECMSEPSTEIVESLILVNNQLQQRDVSMGILAHAQNAYNIELKEDWYEKLGRWDDALAAYQTRQEEYPDSLEITHARMRCLHALGEWESLAQVAAETWPRADNDFKKRMAPLAAAAAWGLQQWDNMDAYISVLSKKDTPDRSWYRSILLIHRNQFAKAQKEINKAREIIDLQLTTGIGESYNRAYSQVVRIQMLAELEEVIAYKSSADNPQRRAMIQRTWMKRLKGCQRDPDVWGRILKVRALVMTPRESMEMWVRFANLCRKAGRAGLAEKTINSLLGPEEGEIDGTTAGPPHVIYAQMKLQWSKGNSEETLDFLRGFTARLAQDLGLDSSAGDSHHLTSELYASGKLADFTRLMARCYHKLGEWQMALHHDWDTTVMGQILQAYFMATSLDPTWCKAWHAWALANSEVVSRATRNLPEGEPLPQEISSHLVAAVQAFFQSIALSPGNALQDTLRLLTLWFRYGDLPDVTRAIADGIRSVSVDTWLDVIPQLIARIHARAPNVRTLVHHVLSDVGRAHPQALVYPLTVASKYPSVARKRSAMAIMDKMREHSATLVEQALLVDQELIRTAILWHELWHEGLEEASRLFYGERNIEAMFDILGPLHDMLERGPETLREVNFQQAHGRELHDAREACRRYRAHNDINDLNQAWDLYYLVFKKLHKALPQMLTIDLQSASPKLLAVKDLELAIPGTYHNGQPLVQISSFAPTFDIIASKQRPRKLKIKGSDGRDYQFLLKGHEDLRQDERVMQLFGLVNTLLAKDSETFQRHLTIQKYSVVPLSPNSGLIGWVDNTDTLHVLIRNYRDSRKILLNIEHRLMLQMAPQYEQLTLIQKLEVFEYALDNTDGRDLYRILWLKSRNSEAWLERRGEYSRSLAVMSMVGHILGLGDRHPSNLLLDRITGLVTHCDFGDCFEVAMQREKYPEKVPFRLTRMLRKAMEIGGIEGTYKATCVSTMRVLRENKESIIAVLEAFVHDPLINWRLVHGARRVGNNAPERTAVEANRGYYNGGAGGNTSSRRPRTDETSLEEAEEVAEVNQRALEVIERVTQKLTGRDFKPTETLDVNGQVERLIQQATSLTNLCTAFVGWCPFW